MRVRFVALGICGTNVIAGILSVDRVRGNGSRHIESVHACGLMPS